MSRWIGACAVLGLLLLAACGGTVSPRATTSVAGSATSAATVATPTALALPVTAVVPTPTASTPHLATPAAVAPAPAGAASYAIVPDQSEARFRVREQLVGRNLPSDAVGTTSKVSGQVVFDRSGAIVKDASKITVDLTSLQSDEPRRDNYIKGNTLQTARYPTAVFVPAEARGLSWPLPASGPVVFQLTGDLTIHGVTRTKTWDVTATVDGHTVQGNASTSLTFEEFGMSAPKVALVLSVADTLRLEFDFNAQQQG